VLSPEKISGNATANNKGSCQLNFCSSATVGTANLES